MSSERGQGLLLILSAPSGTGKTTLARRFLAEHPEAAFSISATTRAPRGQEQDGVDYHFVTPARFAELVAQGALAEWAEVHGQRYGTLRATVDETLSRGRIAIFDIDVQGGAQLEALWPRQAVSVFVIPPTPAELERRLRGRSTDADEVIARRLRAARAEVERGLAQYQYVVVNDVLDDAYRAVESIVKAARAELGGSPGGEARREAERHRRGRIDLSAWVDRVTLPDGLDGAAPPR